MGNKDSVKIVVYRFRVNEYNDPDLFIASELLDWEKSPVGIWVLAHSVESPMWNRSPKFHPGNMEYTITAELPSVHATEFFLKWQ